MGRCEYAHYRMGYASSKMVAAQEALEISERRIVIDHHRRTADL